MAWSDRVLRQLAQMKRTEVAPQINGVYQRALSESQDPAEQLRVLRAIMNKLDEVGLLKRMSEGKKAKKWVLELLERIRLESE
jgi:hypothetical protein